MLDKSMIEPMKLDAGEGETASASLREERLQTREGKTCTRTVKQALAIDILKARKASEHFPE